jgi:hypothetical protein
LRPGPGIPTAFGIEDLLRRGHEFVDRIPAGIRRIGVAARLDSLHFRQLLGGWLLRGKDVIYLLIARIRYLRQAAAQIIDSVRA